MLEEHLELGLYACGYESVGDTGPLLYGHIRSRHSKVAHSVPGIVLSACLCSLAELLPDSREVWHMAVPIFLVRKLRLRKVIGLFNMSAGRGKELKVMCRWPGSIIHVLTTALGAIMHLSLFTEGSCVTVQATGTISRKSGYGGSDYGSLVLHKAQGFESENKRSINPLLRELRESVA